MQYETETETETSNYRTGAVAEKNKKLGKTNIKL